MHAPIYKGEMKRKGESGGSSRIPTRWCNAPHFISVRPPFEARDDENNEGKGREKGGKYEVKPHTHAGVDRIRDVWVTQPRRKEVAHRKVWHVSSAICARR